EEQRQLAVLVPALGASLGVIIDAGGEKVFVVDDRGRIVNDMHFLAAFVSLTMQHAPGVVAVPVYAPSAIEQIVAEQGGRVQRVRASAEAQMSLAAREHPLLVGDGVGGFIFPRFHPSFDGLFATVRLLELLTIAKETLAEVIDATPPAHVARLQVDCPWEQKGRVMRMLAQDPQTERIRQIARAREAGARLVVFPELSLTGYYLKDLAADVACAADDPQLGPIAEASRDIDISAGFVERSADAKLHIAQGYWSKGKLVHVHRK